LFLFIIFKTIIPLALVNLNCCINFEIKSTFIMKEQQDYIRDIAEIRTMMERSSKFLSLSGWAGIMAGIYALSGAYIAYNFFDFNPNEIFYSNIKSGNIFFSLLNI